MPKVKAKTKTGDDVALSVLDPKKPVPDRSKSAADDDLAWLGEGYISPEDSAIDEKLAKIPGKLVDLPVEECVPNDWNPNEQDPKEFDMLVRRMREVGMLSPIQVVPRDDGKYVIIGGEHRWRAAKSLGYKTIPAIVLTDERFASEDLQKFVTMQLNMIAGRLNPEKFLKLYKEMTARYNDKSLKDLMGFTKEHQFKMLTKGIAEGLPEGMREEFKERADKADDPKSLTGILNDLMGKYGNDLRFNFMIFTHEESEHVWVRLNAENHDLVSQALDVCRSRAIDVNVVIDEAFRHVISKFREEAA